MSISIKQLVPQEVCLKCQGCCRFSKANSVWAPCLLEEEIQDMIDRNIPPALIDANRRILPVPVADTQPLRAEAGYICAFFDLPENKCKIYSFRPFECQLYPFLINLRRGKTILTVDLNCPYVQERVNSKEFKEYVEYLAAFFNAPAQIELLKDNPHLLQAYEEVLELIELSFPDVQK